MTSEQLRGPAERARGRVLALVGILLVALHVRAAVTAVSPLLDLVRDDVELTATHAGLLGAVPVVSFALFGALSPAIARAIGLELAVVLAMLASAAGEVLRATTTTAPSFLAFSVLALAGLGVGNVLLPPLVKRYFPDRIGALTAAYSVVMVVSLSVPPLAAVPIAVRYGWRASVATWAVLGVLAVLPWFGVMVRSRVARGALTAVARRDPAAPPRLGRGELSAGRVWRSPLAWAMAVTFSMNTTNGYVLYAWLPQLLADAGIDEATAGTWLAYYAFLGVAPALLVPLAAVRMRRPWLLVAFFVSCLVVGYTGLVFSPSGPLWLWLLAAGLGTGNFPLLLTLINLRTRTHAGAASLSGFTQGLGYALAGAGPVVAGLLHEATGGWDAILWFLVGTALVLGVAGWFACRPVMLEDTWGGKTV